MRIFKQTGFLKGSNIQITSTVMFFLIFFIMPGSSVLFGQNVQSGKTEYSVIAPLAIKSLLLDIARAGDKRIVTVGERGHILVSDDEGKNWKQSVVPSRSTLTTVFFIDKNHGWAAGHDSIIIYTDNGGESWTRQFFAPEKEQALFDIRFRDKKNGIAIGAYGLYLETEDGGQNWNERYIEVLDDPEFGLPHFNAFDMDSDQTMYMACEAGFLARSKDFGKTWESLVKPYIGSYFGNLVTKKGTILLFGLRGNIYRSADHGNSWEHVPAEDKVSINSGVNLNNGDIALVGMNGVIFYSRDDGKSFTCSRRPDRVAMTAGVPVGQNDLVASGEKGILRITAAGKDLDH